ncbi:hypothetical protein JW926_02535 [Candidatus Sumerlaeota bacterium]|nr:hypothetical protein [Candidatus Sumerlaeota bacterium]
MDRRKKTTAQMNEMREEALRPCPILGYDRDALGLHLYSRNAYKLAETQFRRAVWLNPEEPRFKEHLAKCLLRQGKNEEAEILLQSIREDKDVKEGDS